MNAKTGMVIIFGAMIMCTCSDKTAIHPDMSMDCPSSPNCVSSQATDPEKRIAPFKIKPNLLTPWESIKEHVSNLPRTRIIKSTDTEIHAECKSRIFRFTDDLILILDPSTCKIDIRSASRVGYSDLGVNRKRIENLRNILKTEGLID